MLNSDECWITCEMDVICDLLCWITTILTCMLVGLKSLVISLDYRSYMGSSVRIWSLQWLFLYLCSYNLDGSVTCPVSISDVFGLIWKPPHSQISDTNGPCVRRVWSPRDQHFQHVFEHPCFCVPTPKCLTTCARVLAFFHKYFQGLVVSKLGLNAYARNLIT
jgi:hypothetical protein